VAVTRRILWILAGLLLAPSAFCAPDMSAVLKDSMSIVQKNSHLTASLWLSRDFWRAAAANSETSAARQNVENFVKTITPYEVLAVVDGQQGLGGVMQYTDDAVLRKTVTLEDAQGNTVHALDEADLSPDVVGVFRVLRPILVNMEGPLGEHMVFLAFPALRKDGQRLADPTKDGSLVVHVGDVALRYQLPLASSLPLMVDPQTGASFPGNYRFNPFTGSKLKPADEKP
jgi:hypothetical protein